MNNHMNTDIIYGYITEGPHFEERASVNDATKKVLECYFNFRTIDGKEFRNLKVYRPMASNMELLLKTYNNGLSNVLVGLQYSISTTSYKDESQLNPTYCTYSYLQPRNIMILSNQNSQTFYPGNLSGTVYSIPTLTNNGYSLQLEIPKLNLFGGIEKQKNQNNSKEFLRDNNGNMVDKTEKINIVFDQSVPADYITNLKKGDYIHVNFYLEPTPSNYNNNQIPAVMLIAINLQTLIVDSEKAYQNNNKIQGLSQSNGTLYPQIGGHYPGSTATQTGGQYPGSTVTQTGGQYPGSTATQTGGQYPGSTATQTGGHYPGSTATQTGGHYPGSTATQTGGQYPGSTATQTGGQYPGSTATQTGGLYPENTVTPAPGMPPQGGQYPGSTVTQTGGQYPGSTATQTGGHYPENTGMPATGMPPQGGQYQGSTVTQTGGQYPENTGMPAPGTPPTGMPAPGGQYSGINNSVSPQEVNSISM